MLSKFYLAGILALLLVGIASASRTSYVHANGQTIAKINDTGVYYYHPDNVGSTSAMTNNQGEVIEEQTNLPFGELISGSERYDFTGKELDDTGLQYFGARYYLPLTGRFLAIDPALQDFSSYAYAGNNPLTRVDPNGTLWKRIKNLFSSDDNPRKKVGWREYTLEEKIRHVSHAIDSGDVTLSDLSPGLAFLADMTGGIGDPKDFSHPISGDTSSIDLKR